VRKPRVDDTQEAHRPEGAQIPEPEVVSVYYCYCPRIGHDTRGYGVGAAHLRPAGGQMMVKVVMNKKWGYRFERWECPKCKSYHLVAI
jgi:hypothetical protein